MAEKFEVVILGGGISGSCCALILARANVHVAVIENDEDRIGSAIISHNLITRDGVPKSDIVALARQDLEKYSTLKFIKKGVSSIENKGQNFEIRLADGKLIRSQFLVVATGANYCDPILDISGAQELWGSSLFNCPYCHMYEYTGKRVAIVKGFEKAQPYCELLSQWTKHIVLVTNIDVELPTEFNGVERVVHGKIKSFERVEQETICIHLFDGKSVHVDAVLAPGLAQKHCELLSKLDVEFRADSTLPNTSRELETSVSNLFVIGDARTGFSGLVVAQSDAMTVAITIIERFVDERIGKIR